MKIQIKKLYNTAIIPTKANDNDAGYDLYANEAFILPVGGYDTVETGVLINIPKGYYGRVCPRSGLAVKKGIDVLAGVIDSGYIGEIKVVLINHGEERHIINEGDRIAQLIIHKFEDVEREEVKEHEDSQRGQGGFGSSGT